ncbi:dephospho-CoA kinase [Corynebacterium kroppenstedtii]|uniref:dephospho-CoA kinase n=1 Tax=Corynebacterium sp. PCR 32 TaxID=3351342 RepID=UPI0030A2BBD4
MLLVGLTGGIGSGKSTVAARLSDHGAVIVDGDEIAREIVQPGQPAVVELSDEFGSDILMDDGSLDRKMLAHRAFSSNDRTAALNRIMHPRIHDRAFELFRAAPDHSIVVFDMPLLIENDLDQMCGLVVVVTADVRTRIDRLVSNRGFDVDDARRRIRAQLSDTERARSAHVVVDNSGSRDALLTAVDSLWNRRLAQWGHVNDVDVGHGGDLWERVSASVTARERLWRRRAEWISGSTADNDVVVDHNGVVIVTLNGVNDGEENGDGAAAGVGIGSACEYHAAGRARTTVGEKLTWLGCVHMSGEGHRYASDRSGQYGSVWVSGDPINPAVIRY